MKHTLWLVVTLLLATDALATDISSYTAVYDAVSDNVMVEIDLKFETDTSRFEWQIPDDAADIEVENQTFDVIEKPDYKVLVVGDGLFDNLRIKYATESLIEKTKDRFFVLDISQINSRTRAIILKLPEEATLKYNLDSQQTSVFPPASSIITDGRRIIISWDSKDLEGIEAILVIYNKNGGILLAVLLVLILLVILIIVLYLLKNKVRYRKAGSSDITRNLYEEEKKIVEILLEAKDNEMWQKQLEIKSGLSKVRLSRKIMNLVKKGVLEKIQYGNTNKIRIKKEK